MGRFFSQSKHFMENFSHNEKFWPKNRPINGPIFRPENQRFSDRSENPTDFSNPSQDLNPPKVDLKAFFAYGKKVAAALGSRRYSQRPSVTEGPQSPERCAK